MSESISRNGKMVTVALAVFALTALAVALLSGKSDATEAPSMADNFGVLQPASPSAVQALPDGSQEWLGNLPEYGGPAEEPSEVGVADTPAGEVAVVGAEESICVYDPGESMSNCAGSGLAASGQVYTASPVFDASPNGCADWQILGLMPDGVTSLTVDAAGGNGPATIPVTDNVYTATLPPVPTTLSSGDISVEIPLDQFAAGNTAC